MNLSLPIWIGSIALLIFLAGRFGLLSGRAPRKLGVHDGRLKAPSRTPNSVSSQADLWSEHPRRTHAHIDPLPLSGDGPGTMERLHTIAAAMPGATVVEFREDYLYVRFQTPWLRFVDDAEFWLDPKANVIQLRSASRIGRRDFDVNRKRLESIRRRLVAA